MKLALPMLASLMCCAVFAHAGEMPKTLLEMAGAKAVPARLSDSALIIIDAQHEYIDGALPLVGVEAAIAETAQLLARARKSGAPVIHIVHKGSGALFNPAGHSFEIAAPLRPQAGETVIEKARVSAFAGTGLEVALQRTGRKSLIIAGFMTHNCVSSTARAARDLGYGVTIAAATTATRDLPDGKGGIIPAAALQNASLAALADRTAVVVATAGAIPD